MFLFHLISPSLSHFLESSMYKMITEGEVEATVRYYEDIRNSFEIRIRVLSFFCLVLVEFMRFVSDHVVIKHLHAFFFLSSSFSPLPLSFFSTCLLHSFYLVLVDTTSFLLPSSLLSRILSSLLYSSSSSFQPSSFLIHLFHHLPLLPFLES